MYLFYFLFYNMLQQTEIFVFAIRRKHDKGNTGSLKQMKVIAGLKLADLAKQPCCDQRII